MRAMRGFTLVELMVVVLIIGIIAAIAIPNYVAMTARAKEADTKANMHTFQVASEDYSVKNNGVYATDAGLIAAALPSTFVNPFYHTAGIGNAWEDRAYTAAVTPLPGITSYGDSLGQSYTVKGYGKSSAIAIVLTSGQ